MSLRQGLVKIKHHASWIEPISKLWVLPFGYVCEMDVQSTRRVQDASDEGRLACHCIIVPWSNLQCLFMFRLVNLASSTIAPGLPKFPKIVQIAVHSYFFARICPD